MSDFADTSFLVALYFASASTVQAISHLRLSRPPILLSTFEFDRAMNRFRVVDPDWSAVLREAGQRTSDLTRRNGIRSMDLLHLTAARLLGCSDFPTFDSLQREVAEGEGFAVPL